MSGAYSLRQLARSGIMWQNSGGNNVNLVRPGTGLGGIESRYDRSGNEERQLRQSAWMNPDQRVGLPPAGLSTVR